MKIIDLLNKIANGEELPKKIRITDIYDGNTIHYNFFYDEDDQEYKDDELFPLGARLILDRALNKKVEILDKIEEKKILEKLDLIIDEHFTNDELQAYIYETQVKINEIIDKINEVLNDKD